MCKIYLAAICVFFLTGIASAGRYFADITQVDADKGVIVYDITFGKDKKMNVKANVAKDCVIREGQYILGKPATTKEGDVLVNGLKNFVFQKVSREKVARVNIYTADKDDQAKGIKAGDVIKILVHPN